VPLADYCVRVHKAIEGEPRGFALYTLRTFRVRFLEQTGEAGNITGPWMPAHLTCEVPNRPVDQHVRPKTALHHMSCIYIVQPIYHDHWRILEFFDEAVDGGVETSAVDSRPSKMVS